MNMHQRPAERPTAHVDVDLREDTLVVASFDKTKAGFWRMNDYLTLMDATVSDEALGAEVRMAARASKIGVATPGRSDDSPALQRLLRETGVKTFSSYMKGVRQLSLTFYSDRVRATPQLNKGARSGFVPIVEETTELSAESSDAELGTAVRDALDRAR